MTIRKRRRERARARAQAQQQKEVQRGDALPPLTLRADAAVLDQCKREFNFACSSFNGTCCPHCKKPVPPRALFSLTGYYSAVHLSCCGIKPEYCHSDRSRCVAEARAQVRCKFYSTIREE